MARNIQELIKQGYKQVSSQYRTVARLPSGKSGKDALYEAEMAVLGDDLDAETITYWKGEKRRWVNMMGERGSADHFRRVHAQAAGLWIELTQKEFRDFKANRRRTA